MVLLTKKDKMTKKNLEGILIKQIGDTVSFSTWLSKFEVRGVEGLEPVVFGRRRMILKDEKLILIPSHSSGVWKSIYFPWHFTVPTKLN